MIVMLKLLNILAITYLTIAPGMNVGSLLHAIEACRYFEPAAAAAPAVHSCRHHQHPPGHDQDLTPADCDHSHALPVESRVAPVVAPESIAAEAGFGFCCVFHPLHESAGHAPCQLEDSKPPPGPPLVGTIVQLV